ncbi:uncharacterized protein DUF4331 [Winogradskyella eximia]|uniref:Uncharacterized protein DUF4331 n=1 Tax=Winogradskyella eximia TaxID=262006 RepID=A0A3D9GZQ1_9FLAO|nr:DUF4331 family protein [Winogradskyella eximia]RED42737.1 uncharacterized protein DUF4331 [Winogradskyella eximia]
MKKTKFLISTAVLGIATLVAIAADHIDAPAVQGGTSDITDFYAFEGEDDSNIAFVANVQGLLGAGSDTQNAAFDENVLIEFNIDTNDDKVEDLVIQATARDGKMYFFGPVAPSQTGLNSTIASTTTNQASVDISAYGASAIIENANGMKFFAGPRDDPFFMDFAQYGQIIAGNASSFNSPGTDTFAGTNVMSIVIEVPKSMIGGSGTINTWVESKRKQ